VVGRGRYLEIELLLPELLTSSDRRILLVVIDGLGGLPGPDGKTELELASTPHLDSLAERSVCGLSLPIAPGISPGSGPGHLALFGYDPLKYQIGRGVLSALGIAFQLQANDVAARVNFATLDDSGNVLDRRAGRISTDLCARLCAKIENEISLPGVEVFIRPEKEHRAALIFRAEELSDQLSDGDPQKTGVPPLEIRPLSPEAEQTASLVNRFVEESRRVLAGEKPANGLLLRGFAAYQPFPTFLKRYGLRAAAVAAYPMYRGVSRLVGMDVIECGETIDSELKAVKDKTASYDFVFFHLKKTDSAGEDGDFDARIKALESADYAVDSLLKEGFHVVVVTGDHSTPCVLKAHSWHPVPLMLHSEFSGVDGVTRFTERDCALGALGLMHAKDIMPIAMANALRLKKFGA
jgi:2,3-bisphosphoglycerate-independent phosphoglycerate mutase